MEGMLSARDHQSLVSSFLEIAVGETTKTARQFLKATNWKLEEAIHLFYTEHEVGMIPSATPFEPEPYDDQWGLSSDGVSTDLDQLPPPLPVVRDTLYADSMHYRHSSQPGPSSLVAFRNFSDEKQHTGTWEPDHSGSSTSASTPGRSLASFYRPPFHLMFNGSFEQGKSVASTEDKWLLVNLQSTKKFNSHMLNRDTWADETVSQTIKTNFIFWQVYDDTIEGQKVCTFYKLQSVPVVLVIDPITGQKMHLWHGMVEPETLLEDLVPFMDAGPSHHLASLSKKRPTLTPHSKSKDDVGNEKDEELLRTMAAFVDINIEESPDTVTSAETLCESDETCSSNAMPTFPSLPEEPKCDDRSVLCRVGIRLPNGKRLQRNFLKTDSIQLLWSFCYSELEESERKPLKLMQAIPGASKTVEFDSDLTFDQSGLANSMISATWE